MGGGGRVWGAPIVLQCAGRAVSAVTGKRGAAGGLEPPRKRSAGSATVGTWREGRREGGCGGRCLVRRLVRGGALVLACLTQGSGSSEAAVEGDGLDAPPPVGCGGQPTLWHPSGWKGAPLSSQPSLLSSSAPRLL